MKTTRLTLSDLNELVESNTPLWSFDVKPLLGLDCMWLSLLQNNGEAIYAVNIPLIEPVTNRPYDPNEVGRWLDESCYANNLVRWSLDSVQNAKLPLPENLLFPLEVPAEQQANFAATRLEFVSSPVEDGYDLSAYEKPGDDFEEETFSIVVAPQSLQFAERVILTEHVELESKVMQFFEMFDLTRMTEMTARIESTFLAYRRLESGYEIALYATPENGAYVVTSDDDWTPAEEFLNTAEHSNLSDKDIEWLKIRWKEAQN